MHKRAFVVTLDEQSLDTTLEFILKNKRLHIMRAVDHMDLSWFDPIFYDFFPSSKPGEYNVYIHSFPEFTEGLTRKDHKWYVPTEKEYVDGIGKMILKVSDGQGVPDAIACLTPAEFRGHIEKVLNIPLIPVLEVNDKNELVLFKSDFQKVMDILYYGGKAQNERLVDLYPETESVGRSLMMRLPLDLKEEHQRPSDGSYLTVSDGGINKYRCAWKYVETNRTLGFLEAGVKVLGVSAYPVYRIDWCNQTTLHVSYL